MRGARVSLRHASACSPSEPSSTRPPLVMSDTDPVIDWSTDADVTQPGKISDAQALKKGWANAKVAGVLSFPNCWFHYKESLTPQHMTTTDVKANTTPTLIQHFPEFQRMVRNRSTFYMFIFASPAITVADIHRNAARHPQISSRQRPRNVM
jgi:hypothetical protein